jgi:hypothetical protein
MQMASVGEFSDMENRIYAFLKSFSRGINSDVDPLLLTSDQLSFASNATVRGNFIHQRPAFFNLTLNYDKPQTGTNFQTGLFQGSAYYRTANNGFIMVAVGGRLFSIAIGTNQTALISEIPLPSLNSTTAVQNWLWQSENFLFWNDGINKPMFYDGNSARRSFGSSPIQLGSVAVSFTVPTQNQYVLGDIQLNGNWTAGVGMVLIGQALYYVQSFYGGSVGGRITIGLNAITFSAGDLISPGAAISLNNKNCGTILNAVDVSNADITSFPALPAQGTSGTSATLQVLTTTPPAASTVSIGTAVSDSPQYCGLISSASLSSYPSAPVAAISGTPSFVSIPVPSSGAYITSTGIHPIGFNYSALFSGDTISISGFNCRVNSLTTTGDTYGTVNGINFTPLTNSATGIGLSSVSIGVSSKVFNGTTYPANTFIGSGAGAMNGGSAAIPNQFTLNLSKTFQGVAGDNLLINGVTVVVVGVSGKTVTCQMPSGYVDIGTQIPLNNTIVVNTSRSTPQTSYGVTQTAGISVANGMTLILPSSASPVAGQTLEFNAVITAGGGTQSVVALVTSASTGTVGQNLNKFSLTLSIPFTGNVGDTLHVGTGNTLATMTVIAKISASVIQCQMTNTPVNALIPITSAVPTVNQIVINDTANGTLTGVGTYPLNDGGSPPTLLNPLPVSSSFNITALPGASPQVGQIVQIPTSLGAIDLFQVMSVSGGSVGSQPKIRVQNINDTQGNTINAGTFIYSIPEFDVSKMGVYGMGRNWVSLADGTEFVAGDLVGGATGSQFYKFKDSVIKVAQNYFLAGGGTFSLPGSGEQIRAMQFTAQIDASLGQGSLQVFTDDTVFGCRAPTDITTWANLASPILTESLIGSGGISQDDVVQSNGDLTFRLSDGGMQSLLMARLDFNKWGNTPISKEVRRSIENDDPALLPFSSGARFNNRRLSTCQFVQTARDPISSLSGKAPSVWEGEWNGLNVLKLVTGFFNSKKQCYALCLSNDKTQIELHQIQLDKAATMDNGNSPIFWTAESSMLFQDNPGLPRQYKRLINGEFSFQKITADVSYQIFYRTDQNPNWTLWYSSKITYQGTGDPGYRRRIPFGEPSGKVFDATNNQPMREGYNFQIKMQFTGSGMPVAMRLAADLIDEPEFAQPK